MTDADSQKDSSFSGDGPMVCNHMLGYIAYGLLNSTEEQIKDACIEFFSVPEIISARDLALMAQV
jgi:hypothetical protein